MLFGLDPRRKALREAALKRIEAVLKEMQRDGVDLARLKLRKYQKTHYASCACVQCLEARRSNDPHKRGLLESGYKLYVGPGGEGEEREQE